MNTLGIYDVKARLSEVCEQVAQTHQPVTVTKRGKPLVRIDPIESAVMTIRERREDYMKRRGRTEKEDEKDFEPPDRSPDTSTFELGGGS
jgi:prevent-host-death family protein